MVGVHTVKVRRRGLTAVVVSFSGPMDPVLAANLGAYQLTTLSRGRHPSAVPLGITTASYNAATYAVTLSLIRPLKRGPLSLSILGGAITGQNGLALATGFSARVA